MKENCGDGLLWCRWLRNFATERACDVRGRGGVGRGLSGSGGPGHAGAEDPLGCRAAWAAGAMPATRQRHAPQRHAQGICARHPVGLALGEGGGGGGGDPQGHRGKPTRQWRGKPCPPCDIPSGCCSFTGPWTVTRSSLRMLRRVAAFCRPLRPVLLLVSFPRFRSAPPAPLSKPPIAPLAPLFCCQRMRARRGVQHCQPNASLEGEWDGDAQKKLRRREEHKPGHGALGGWRSTPAGEKMERGSVCVCWGGGGSMAMPPDVCQRPPSTSETLGTPPLPPPSTAGPTHRLRLGGCRCTSDRPTTHAQPFALRPSHPEGPRGHGPHTRPPSPPPPGPRTLSHATRRGIRRCGTAQRSLSEVRAAAGARRPHPGPTWRGHSSPAGQRRTRGAALKGGGDAARTGSGKDALEGKGPRRRPQRRLGRRLEEVAEAVGSGYCRLRMPLKLALAVGGTVAGYRLGALEGGGVVWHKASVSDCLPLAAPIGLSPLLSLTLRGPERVLVVSGGGGGGGTHPRFQCIAGSRAMNEREDTAVPIWTGARARWRCCALRVSGGRGARRVGPPSARRMLP